MYHCERCGTGLDSPLETYAVYVLPEEEEDPVLICKGCHQESDLIVWGTTREQDEEAGRQAALRMLAAIEMRI
ncbi:MAG: hypothetical protein PHI12_11735 [Dehalococcoidales bacterium]|nr:hypothetical protein [Dehalococcoidales bacterium]